jgi:S-formylglutathione hydrolase FrmB
MDWSTRTDLATIARSVPLVIVMPEGENAWFTNAADKGPRFEDYIADDMVKDVESKYRVIRSRYGRAIAGLSMAGYGALKMGLRHPGTFVAAAGFSSALGVTDPKFDDAMPSFKDQLYKIYGPAGSDTRQARPLNCSELGSVGFLHLLCHDDLSQRARTGRGRSKLISSIG